MPVRLREVQRIPTSGARAVETLTVDGLTLVAIPQLAVDLPGPRRDERRRQRHRSSAAAAPRRALHPARDPAGAGWRGRRVLHHRRPCLPGRREHPLRVRSVHATRPTSTIHEWSGSEFVPFQSITDVRRQAVPALDRRRASLPRTGPGSRPAARRGRQPALGDLRVARRPVRGVPDDPVDVGLQLARVLGRRAAPPGARRPPRTQPALRVGRAIATSPTRTCWRVPDARSPTWPTPTTHFLLVAGLEEPPVLWRWDGDRFHQVQTLAGLGARELRVLRQTDRTYRRAGELHRGHTRRPTTGADLAGLRVRRRPAHGRGRVPHVGRHGRRGRRLAGDGETRFIVSNSLSPDVRFATDTVVYAMTSEPAAA